MVNISIYKNKSGDFIGVKCFGHSGYAKSGQDIVCAAVSVLMINAVNSIEQLTSDVINCNVNEESALIDFRLEKEPGEEALLLIQSLVLGLQGIKSDYGKFIKIDMKEV